MLERTVWVRLCETRNAPIGAENRTGAYGEYFRGTGRRRVPRVTIPGTPDSGGFARAKVRKAARDRHQRARAAVGGVDAPAGAAAEDLAAVSALFNE